MGTRALGINSVMGGAFETTFGTPPGANGFKLPFVSSQLGEERGLMEDDQLGYGREGLDPTPDVANNVGDVTVPMDTRAIGFWLKLLMGAPTTTAKDAATGSFSFTAQPAATSTITVAGTAFTFVAAGPTGNQILIGANLPATLVNVAAALNASVIAGVAAATYAVSGTKITATFDLAGTTGNAMTLAASAPSNATVSGATLAGGTNQHSFTSGSNTLPSASIEIGLPEVPDFAMHYGARANQFKVSAARSGMLNAVLSLICQGELPGVDTSAAGSLAALKGPRFAQASGSVLMDSVAIGGIVAGDVAYSNNLETVDTIRPDGRIEDTDVGQIRANGSLTIKYATRALKSKAEAGTPVALVFTWAKDAANLSLTMPRVFLPKTKNPITGPKGIQAQYQYQASGALGAQFVAVLVNDVAGY